MGDLELFARVILALGFGAILGLETEIRSSSVSRRKTIGGVRTYTVLSLFGAVSGILYANGHEVVAYLMFTAVVSLIVAAYILNVTIHKAFGITTEIAVLLTMLLGFAITSGLISVQLLIVMVIILTYILSQKHGISALTKHIAHAELQDVVKFMIVTIVIFPLLPDQNYYIADLPIISDIMRGIGFEESLMKGLIVVNPFRLWQYVVLISGFSLLGYFAHRVWGKTRGILLTGLFGGFISSTATTITLAIKQRKEKGFREYVAAALIANASSFVHLILLAVSASVIFFNAVLPLILAMIVGLLLTASYFIITKSKDGKLKEAIEYEPYSITPALKFALLLTVVRIGVQLIDYYFGEGGFIIATSATALVGMDIATITLGESVAQQPEILRTAMITFMLANGVNFIAKFVYSYAEGAKRYALGLLSGLFCTFIIGCTLLLSFLSLNEVG